MIVTLKQPTRPVIAHLVSVRQDALHSFSGIIYRCSSLGNVVPIGKTSKRQFDRSYRDVYLKDEPKENKKPRGLKISLEAIGLLSVLKSGCCWKGHVVRGRKFVANTYYYSIRAMSQAFGIHRESLTRILDELEAASEIVRASNRHGSQIRIVVDAEERSALIRAKCVAAVAGRTATRWPEKPATKTAPPPNAWPEKPATPPHSVAGNPATLIDPIKRLDPLGNSSFALGKNGDGEKTAVKVKDGDRGRTPVPTAVQPMCVADPLERLRTLPPDTLVPPMFREIVIRGCVAPSLDAVRFAFHRGHGGLSYRKGT